MSSNRRLGMIWFIVFLSIFSSVLLRSSFGDIVQDLDDDEDNSGNPSKKRLINFASHQAGAVIVDKSPSNGKGFNNLLNDDRDKYAICSSNEKKWVVIGLSEEVAITAIAIANYEKYSSTVREFHLLGSLKYPTTEWNDLGTYVSQLMLGEQYFNITPSELSHTRYLKVKFLSHYLDEELFTLSQIKVFGQTVFASLQDEVARSDENDIKMLLQDVRDDLQREDWLLSNEGDDIAISTNIPGDEERDNTPSTLIEQEASEAANDSNKLPPADVLKGGDENVPPSSHTSDRIESTLTNDSQDNSTEVSESAPFNTKIAETVTTDVNHSEDKFTEEENAKDMQGERSIRSEERNELNSDNEGLLHDINDRNNTILTETVDAKPIPVAHEAKNKVEEENDEGLTVEHEASGQLERLQFNRTEWSIIRSALERSNLTVDFLKSTIQSIKEFFVDPLSQQMDVTNLERFISTQELPSKENVNSNDIDLHGNNDDTNIPHNIHDEESTIRQQQSSHANGEKEEINENMFREDNIASDSTVVETHKASDHVQQVREQHDGFSSSTSSDESNGNQDGIAVVKQDANAPISLEHDQAHDSSLTSAPHEQHSFNFTSSSSLSADHDSINEESHIISDVVPDLKEQEESFSNNTHNHINLSQSNDGGTTIEVSVNSSQKASATKEENPSVSLDAVNDTNLSAPHTAESLTSPDFATDNNTSTIKDSTKDFHHSAYNIPHEQSTSASSHSDTPHTKHAPLTWITCFDQLKFSDFQGRMLAKLQHKNSSSLPESTNTSIDVTSSSSTSSTSSNSNANNNNNNIFKQIIQRMKSLETNQAITEIYLAQLSDCLRLMRDEMMDRHQAQEEHNMRAQQNPLSALFTLSFTNSSSRSTSSPSLTKVHVTSTHSPESETVSTVLSPFLLPLLSPSNDVPFDAFWSRMLEFIKVMIRIMIRFIWIVTLAGRQEQSSLLTSTLQELRQLLQTSVIEFWCALVCGLVVSLLSGIVFVIVTSVWFIIWCCCGQGRQLDESRFTSPIRRRYIQ